MLKKILHLIRKKKKYQTILKHVNDITLLQAIEDEQSASEIMILIDNNPKAAKWKDSHGNYPLHIACHHCRYDSVIMKLLELFPQASQEKNSDDDYPLHIALRYCRYRSDDDDVVILKLLEAYPRAAESTSAHHGMYPLHLACRYYKSEEVIERLLHLYPAALQEKDNTKQCHPIHFAISNGMSLHIISLFVDTDSSVLQQTDNNDRTPFHYACCHNRIDLVTKWLDDPNVRINTVTKDGVTPLHEACRLGFYRIAELLFYHPDTDFVQQLTDVFHQRTPYLVQAFTLYAMIAFYIMAIGKNTVYLSPQFCHMIRSIRSTTRILSTNDHPFLSSLFLALVILIFLLLDRLSQWMGFVHYWRKMMRIVCLFTLLVRIIPVFILPTIIHFRSTNNYNKRYWVANHCNT